MNWSDFLGADPGKQDSLPTVEVRAKRDWGDSHLPKFNHYIGASGGTISNYTPTFWDKAKESNNPFVQFGYGIADGYYTYAQAMNPLDTKVTHLGHGLMTQDEAQDLAMVHGSIIPGAGAAGSAGKSASIFLRNIKNWSKFNILRAFKNAISPLDGGLLTRAGRAVTKHPKYFGFNTLEDLQKVYKSPKEINKLASSRLKDVLRNGKMTSGAGGRYPKGWVTYTLPNGNAASWGLDGTFIGFRGIK
jgi:hypothetical protein